MSTELVEVRRSGFREGVHRGSLIVLSPDGRAEVTLGVVDEPIFPRSTNKPMQATALLRAGFEPVDRTELAIATASHYGEPEHLRLVRRLLDRFDLSTDHLRCPPELPTDEPARARAVQHGGPSRIAMNCSGKHAAMLATCRVNGWPIDSYLDPAHPAQCAVLATVSALTDEPEPATLGTDGCGAPIVPVSLRGLARAFGRFAIAAAGTPERRVADAIRGAPYVISGTGAADLQLVTAVPGLVTKAGADGVHAGALPDGTAFAFKIDDGGERARLPLAAAILRRMGADVPIELLTSPVLGGGEPVGMVRVLPGRL
ncbi:asparaginase [Skermania piniformis]|uniref:Asparaginase n=1 Tax=Skermania pinensis TaxID=39122 RepID=A0ABX8SAG5_9ACTN|nr:asparaginase [Skermania piniformis]QXQ13470.1 asparaginase [Skermania piniformis]